MVSLAMAITSSTSSNLKSGARGPNVSSVEKAMSCVAPVTMVGCRKAPGIWSASPPRITSAPFCLASAICSCTFSMASVLMSGPSSVPSSRPSPTFIWLTRSFSFSAKAS